MTVISSLPYRPDDPTWGNDRMWDRTKVMEIHRLYNGASQVEAGRELVVCEGKFFSVFNSEALKNQLGLQRRQVGNLFGKFGNRSRIRAYRHVAILPESPRDDIGADAVLTWDDSRVLADKLMGPKHYVSASAMQLTSTKRGETRPFTTTMESCRSVRCGRSATWSRKKSKWGWRAASMPYVNSASSRQKKDHGNGGTRRTKGVWTAQTG